MSKESFDFNAPQEEVGVVKAELSEVKKGVAKKAGVLAAIGAAVALFAHSKSAENPQSEAENASLKNDPIVAMTEGDVDSGTPKGINPNIKIEKAEGKTDGSLVWTVADKE
ncbi:MAG: hypothetical protein PHF79_03690 [Candidatus Pacebacteria bacterium]|nr:hypothetical protein [Candidatus Paceibacterota bacterium]